MRRLSFCALLAATACTCLDRQSAWAEIGWGFKFGDETNTVVGTFVSDGRQSQLDGDATTTFQVTRLNNVFVNGSPPDLETPLDPAGPRSPTGDVLPQRIEWNATAQRVESLPDGQVLSWFSDTFPVQDSELGLSLSGGEFGAVLRDNTEMGFSIGPNLAAMVTPVRRRLLGSDLDGILYDVDIDTGLATNPRDTGIDGLAGIRFAPDGTLYGLQVSLDPRLYTIDPTTGDATAVGRLELPNQLIEGDLDFNPLDDQLYGLYDAVLAADLRLSTISVFTIETTDGRATVFGSPARDVTDFVDLSATAFDTEGTWYALGSDRDAREIVRTDLLTLSTVTGSVLTTTPIEFDGGEPLLAGELGGMAFDPFTGRLFFADGGNSATDALYIIDPETAEVVTIGPTGLADGLTGLTFPPAMLFGDVFPPTVIPEPAGSTLVMVAAMGYLVASRRHRKRRLTFRVVK